MIACISPALSNVEESTSTLRYAERTRNIKNAAVRNVTAAGAALSPREAAALRRENQRLKLELARRDSRAATIAAGGGGHFAGPCAPPAAATRETAADDASSSSPLRCQVSALLAENGALQERARRQAEEVLAASLRADRWQAQSEALSRRAREQGVALSEEEPEGGGGVVDALRRQLDECQTELSQARTETAVARATAGAVLVAGNGDWAHVEATLLNGEDDASAASPSKEEQARDNEQLTTELSAVSATIEQKEAMVSQMHKERACMEHLQHHFETSLRLLQTEVEALTAERDALMKNLPGAEGGGSGHHATQRRRCKASHNPVTQRLREQIGKLEGNIEALQAKASEQRRSLKRKEEAERKCARLLADIAQDKQRRADLQRKLKEASTERRAEKKAAHQNEMRMMKDSRRLKLELAKMKSAAQRQAAVLKRKIDQASVKEKARVVLEHKRRAAAQARLASSSREAAGVREDRKAELASWIDRELEYSLIKVQIDAQRRQLDEAVSERQNMRKNSSDTVEVEDVDQMDGIIHSLRATVQDLEAAAKETFPDAESNLASNFRFLKLDTFKSLSRVDAKFVLSYIFDACSSAKQELGALASSQEATSKAHVESALVKARQAHEKELMKARMEHAQVTLNLLESTQGTLNSNIKFNMETAGTEDELKRRVAIMLKPYNESWTATTSGLISELEAINETQESLQKMMDAMAKGMSVPKKARTKKKTTVEYDSEDFESEDSFVEDGDGEDSEYEPTPDKSKRRRRSPRLAKEAAAKQVAAPDSPSSPIGENYIDDIDRKKVQSLKKACKKLGVPITGKKAELKERVRESILNMSAVLNASVALPHPAEGNDESFIVDPSANKRVNFELDVSADPDFPMGEFSPIHEDPSPERKQLWQDTGDLSLEPEPKRSASPRTSASKTSSRRTPSKRARSPGGSAEKENVSSCASKRRKPLGFGVSSPRVLALHNPPASSPAHLKQT